MFFGDTIFMFFARTILSSATADSAIACGDEILMYNSGLEGAGIGCWNWWWWGGGGGGRNLVYRQSKALLLYSHKATGNTPPQAAFSIYIYSYI